MCTLTSVCILHVVLVSLNWLCLSVNMISAWADICSYYPSCFTSMCLPHLYVTCIALVCTLLFGMHSNVSLVCTCMLMIRWDNQLRCFVWASWCWCVHVVYLFCASVVLSALCNVTCSRNSPIRMCMHVGCICVLCRCYSRVRFVVDMSAIFVVACVLLCICVFCVFHWFRVLVVRPWLQHFVYLCAGSIIICVIVGVAIVSASLTCTCCAVSNVKYVHVAFVVCVYCFCICIAPFVVPMSSAYVPPCMSVFVRILCLLCSSCRSHFGMYFCSVFGSIAV